MQDCEKFVKEFATKLDGKIPDEELRVIMQELEIYTSDYDIKRRETLPVPYGYFPDCLKTYLVSVKIAGRSDGTVKRYKECLCNFFLMIQRSIADITANDIRFYLYEMGNSRGNSNRTVNWKRVILNSFFEWCVDEGYITNNPAASVTPIKYEEHERNPLNQLQLEVLRDVCVDLRDKAMVETLYTTGCRITELLNIKLSDIDFDTYDVHISSTTSKSKKDRDVRLNAKAFLAIKKYLGARKGNSEYLFASKRKPYDKIQSKEIVERRIKELGEQCGIENMCPHRMRHTVATHMVSRGVPIQDVQAYLGHERVETTSIYVHKDRSRINREHSLYVV